MLNPVLIFLYCIILGMELSWLYALLNAANKSVNDILSIPLLTVVLLLSCTFSLALRFVKWPRPVLTALSWAIWPVVMLLMVKVQLFPALSIFNTAWLESIPRSLTQIFTRFEPALFILLSTAALWWLGRRWAYLKPGFSGILWEFQFGLVMF